MSTNSDAAEQVVRFYLEGFEVVAKISGKGAEHAIAILLNVLKQKEQTKGKTRLNSMLKSGKALKIFTIQKKDLAKFAQEAKRYGVLYSALVDRHNKNLDGMVDIMVRDEDASKINRIVERFKLTTSNPAQIKTEIERDLKEKQETKKPLEKGIHSKSPAEIKQELAKTKPIQKEESEMPNFNSALTEKKNLLEQNFENTKEGKSENKSQRKSVRKELAEIKEEMGKEKEEKAKTKTRAKTTKETKSKTSKKKER